MGLNEAAWADNEPRQTVEIMAAVKNFFTFDVCIFFSFSCSVI